MKYINNLISAIEDSFNLDSVTLSEYSTLSDFSPHEIDMILFISEIDLEFDIDLNDVYGDKLLTAPLFEIAKYLEERSNEQNK